MSNIDEGYMVLVNDKEVRKRIGNGEGHVGVRHKFNASAAPGVDDDKESGFRPGSMWIINQAGDATDGDVYICTDASEGAAVWQQIHDDTV